VAGSHESYAGGGRATGRISNAGEVNCSDDPDKRGTLWYSRLGVGRRIKNLAPYEALTVEKTLRIAARRKQTCTEKEVTGSGSMVNNRKRGHDSSRTVASKEEDIHLRPS
jgi:ABC-type uncharacterized transport system ATPase subunit